MEFCKGNAKRLSTYILFEKRNISNNLTIQLKELEKQKQTKLKLIEEMK
jgi:hypothetical protein